MWSDSETPSCKASVFRAAKLTKGGDNKVEGEWVWTFRLKFKFTFLLKSWEEEDARTEERRACNIFHSYLALVLQWSMDPQTVRGIIEGVKQRIDKSQVCK